MKEIPKYLEKINAFMAKKEEESGGMKAEEAASTFKKELIRESLTAKANPAPGSRMALTSLERKNASANPEENSLAWKIKTLKLYLSYPLTKEDRAYYEKELKKAEELKKKQKKNPHPKSRKYPDDNSLDVMLPIEVLADEKRKKLNFKLYTKAKDQNGDEYSVEVKDGVVVIHMDGKDYRQRLDDFLSRSWLDEGLGETNEAHRIFIEYISGVEEDGRWAPPISEKWLVNSHKLSREIIEKVHKIYPETLEETMKSNPRKSAGFVASDFDPKQLALGTEHEMEHTDDPEEAKRIAMDHLVEDPQYYTKLKVCVESNPTNPAVSELTSVFFDPFKKSPLGQVLTQQEQEELWRDIEVFSKKLIDKILDKQMGIRVKRGSGGEPASMEYDNRAGRILTPSEQAPRVENARYHRLFLTAYYMSLLERMFFTTPRKVAQFLNASEGGKTAQELSMLSNRQAHAEFVRTGMHSLMNTVSVTNLARWASGPQGDKSYDELYARAKKLWDRKQAENADIGKQKLKENRERIRALKPEEPTE